MKIVPVTESLYSQILEINRNAVPHVNDIGMEVLEELHAQSLFFVAVIDDELDAPDQPNSVLGFLLALEETAEYDSLNFQYFKQNYESFVYVDRIVVADGQQGNGYGRNLYTQLQVNCSDKPIVCCEVNIRPPNPDSIEFHKAIGFRSVAEQETEAGKKRVSLMIKTN